MVTECSAAIRTVSEFKVGLPCFNRVVLSVDKGDHDLEEDGKSGAGDPCGTTAEIRDYLARTGLPQSTIGYLPLTK